MVRAANWPKQRETRMGSRKQAGRRGEVSANSIPAMGDAGSKVTSELVRTCRESTMKVADVGWMVTNRPLQTRACPLRDVVLRHVQSQIYAAPDSKGANRLTNGLGSVFGTRLRLRSSRDTRLPHPCHHEKHLRLSSTTTSCFSSHQEKISISRVTAYCLSAS